MKATRMPDVFETYENIRSKNEAEAQRRRSEVYGKVPELETLYEQIRTLQLERIYKTAQGEAFDASGLSVLRQKAAKLLIDAGFDAHCLDPIYSCPICRDTGMRDDARHCDCFLRYRLENKLNEARLTDETVSFEKYNLNVFDDTTHIENDKTQRDQMRNCKRRTEKWANSFPTCLPIMLLAGSAGLGKTYTAKCIQRRVIERGHSAAYYTAYRLFSLFHSHRLGEDIDLDAILTVPLLIIDDLGTEPMTRNVTVEYLFDLLNERVAQGLHTVIATNLGFHEIKDIYGERIHSRLMDARHSEKLIFRGRDIRY